VIEEDIPDTSIPFDVVEGISELVLLGTGVSFNPLPVPVTLWRSSVGNPASHTMNAQYPPSKSTLNARCRWEPFKSALDAEKLPSWKSAEEVVSKPPPLCMDRVSSVGIGACCVILRSLRFLAAGFFSGSFRVALAAAAARARVDRTVGTPTSPSPSSAYARFPLPTTAS
jgi:hypothetical protein|tara:strand:+ start:554 stop:1063 length:510 start_codon:yes stop_codon:yes gene_type:complete